MTKPRYFHILLFFIVALLCWTAKERVLQQLPVPLSVTSCRQRNKKLPQASTENRAPWAVSSFKTAAPLHAPSKEELQEFPGARVVEALEIKGANSGETIRMRILETHFKDPYIRTEETIDKDSGALLHRSEMAAGHLLVRLPDQEDPEAFLNGLGPDAIALERVTTTDPLYRLQLGSHALAALPRVFAEIANKQLSGLHEEPDFFVHAAVMPNNPLYHKQWYLWKKCAHVSGYDDSVIFFSGIDAFDAWNIRTSADSVVVAVIDTGIRYTHEDLAANMWHENNPFYGNICGWNFSVKDDDAKKSDPMDGFGHGTACAGIIGAVGNSGIGIVGVAWKVKLMALKFLDDQGMGVISDGIRAMDFACEHGAKILNCSWGYPSPGTQLSFTQDNSIALKGAISHARDQGVIVVAAAGNQKIGKDNDCDPEYPANYSLDNIVSVAATTADNQLASFSNYGSKTVHLAAPGEEIYSTWARSDCDYITDQTRKEILLKGQDAAQDEKKDLETQPHGTSFSVPQVVGALALLKQQFPTWTHQQLIKRVINTSDKIPSLAGKVIGGRLNVARALGDPGE